MNLDDPTKRKEIVSVVMAISHIKNEEIHEVISKSQSFLDKHYFDYEIIVISDCPSDAKTENIRNLLTIVPHIRFIHLSYEVSIEVAITIGLEASIGDYVFIINPNQDPIELILDMQERCKNGVDIILGIDNNPYNTFSYRLVRPLVKKALNEIGYRIPQNATTLRCLTRNAVNSVTKAQNFHHQIFVRISNCGLKTELFEYRLKDTFKKKKKLFDSFTLALKLVIFNSTKPLRWMSILGIFGSFLSLIISLYSFTVRLFNENVADGWSSTIIVISILFMILFTILSFFGEYLGRLLNEHSSHEPYWVTHEYHSTVKIDSSRLNVFVESK